MIPQRPQLSASSRSVLYEIATANPQIHVLTDLFVKLKKDHETRSTDLEKTRSLLLEICNKEVRAANYADASRYNNAVVSFNRFLPENPLDVIPPAPLVQLFNECMRPVRTEAPVISPSATVNFATYFFSLGFPQRELFEEIAEEFIDRGGKVIYLPAIANNERLQEAVPVTGNEEIVPACYAGWYRSAVCYLYAAHLQQHLGMRFGEKTRPTHGLFKGYDPSFLKPIDRFWKNDSGENPGQKYFIEAFGMSRPPRSGYDLFTRYQKDAINRDEMQAEFRAMYYKHDLTKPKIFWTFKDTGFHIMQNLLTINKPGKDNSFPMRNITIVLTPDNDWISESNAVHALKKQLKEAEARIKDKSNASIRPFSDLTNEERRKVYWAFVRAHDLTDEVKELLESYVEYIESLKVLTNNDPIDAMLIIEGYRVAYWKWSGAIVPVVSSAECEQVAGHLSTGSPG